MEIWLNTLTENLNDKKSERYDWINKNTNLYPQIKILPSVDGRDKELVKKILKETNLSFYQTGFKTYGTLAVFLSKFLAWEKQIKENIPYMCLIEDDIELYENFLPFLEEKKYMLDSPSVNILRLGDWGEAYLTSFDSAKRLIEKIQTDGIRRNIDEQLWDSGEVVINESVGGGTSGIRNEDMWLDGVWKHVGYKHSIFKLLKKTNSGLPLNTDVIEESLSRSFFAGGPFDIREKEIKNIINNSHGKKYLTFCLGSAAVVLLEHLKENDFLMAYEWGDSYNSCVNYKNSFRIVDEKFIINNLSKNIPSLVEDFKKKWGRYDEEIPSKIIYDLMMIDYKKYDVYILDGFLRGFTAFLALYNNPKAEVFIHDASRGWYDWLKEIFDTEFISSDIMKVSNKK